MNEFSELVDNIWKTVMDAKDNMMEALENKASNGDLAAMYYRVASNRITDAEQMIKQAESCLNRAESTQNDDFDSMDILWEADHKRILKNIGHVKIYMEMYR